MAVVLSLCLSCSKPTRVVVDMYDGFEFAEQRLARVRATTFVIALIEPDESKVLFEFTIPDDQVRPLPLTVPEISGIRTTIRPPPQARSPFHGGTFTVTRAIRGSAFEVEFDLGSGADRVVGRGVARPASQTRPAVWPYDPRPPKPSVWARIMDALGE